MNKGKGKECKSALISVSTSMQCYHNFANKSNGAR